MYTYENNEMVLKGSSLVCGSNLGSACMEFVFLLCGKNKNGAVNVETVLSFRLLILFHCESYFIYRKPYQ